MTAGSLGGALQRWTLCVLLFLLPFSKAAIEIGFGFLLLGWILERWDPRTRGDTVWLRPSFRPLAAAVFAWLAVCALSIFVSSHPRESVEGFIGKWLEYLMFFVIAADLGGRSGMMQRIGTVFAWSSVFVVIEGLSQEVLKKGIFRGFRLLVFQRMTGPYENPIDLATYFMIAIPILLGYAATRTHRRARGAVWALVAVLVACLGRTLAFGAWISFVAALGMLAWRRGPLRRPALVTAGAVMAAGLGFMTLRGEWYLLTFSDVGTHDRVWMWQAALGMIRDQPLLGHGVNTFMANYLDYWVGGDSTPRYAHNCYLQVAAETGLIGLAAFIALLGAAVHRMWLGLRVPRDAERPLLLGLAAGLIAFLIQAGYDTNFYAMRQVALFWILMGLAVGLSARINPPDA